jgi:hypothetical protein
MKFHTKVIKGFKANYVLAHYGRLQWKLYLRGHFVDEFKSEAKARQHIIALEGTI